MDLKGLSIEQLKALAYDQVVKLNRAQSNLNVLQSEIEARHNVPEKPKESKKSK